MLKEIKLSSRAIRAAAATLLVLVLAAAGWADEPDQAPEVPPEVQWHAFDEGVSQALSQGKHIMVDIYTDWCGWCKKLDRETYADYGVRDILAESYISVKLKGDSGRKLKVRKQAAQYGGQTLIQFVATDELLITEARLSLGILKVRSYPTILFLSPDGKIITLLPGFHNAASFTNIINFIKADLYEVMTYKDYLESVAQAKVAEQEKS